MTDDELRHSITVYNENRRLVRELYAFRAQKPWQTPASEVYLLMRAGLVLPVEEHTVMLREYLAAVAKEERPRRDNCRVVLTGVFCEQPPLNLIKSLELAGCYVVDDDLHLVTRWLTSDCPIEGDPLKNLALAFLHHSEIDGGQIRAGPRRRRASIWCARSSGPRRRRHLRLPELLRSRRCSIGRCCSTCSRTHNIPFIAFKYAENSGQMQPIREQAGTFADSIKLWSGA